MLSETVKDVDFAVVYRAERKPLVRFVLFLGCADPDLAEDIAHTAFARAFPVWPTIRNPKAWLRKVAQNELARRSRAAARETSLDAAPERAERAAAVSAAIAAQQQAETREILAAMITELPAKQRQVMAWHWDGFSDNEIAAHIGDSPAAVRKNRSRAMNKLRLALTQLGKEAT